MRRKADQKGFTFLTTVLVLSSVFVLMHTALSMRMQQKANGAHRSMVKLQTDWLASSAVEQALASLNESSGALPLEKEYEVEFATSYIVSDPVSESENDSRAVKASCSYSIQSANAPLNQLGIERAEKAVLVAAKATTPFRNSSIQSEMNMLCVKKDGRWVTMPVVK
ncbi:hypothetical protein K8I31_07395 [bacterium]|nr:hypothetical protein [bacterium]